MRFDEPDTNKMTSFRLSGSRMIIENRLVLLEVRRASGLLRERFDLCRDDQNDTQRDLKTNKAEIHHTWFEVGRDGKTAYERLKGKSAKVQDLSFAGGILWKKRRAGGTLGTLMFMCEDGVLFFGGEDAGEVIVGNQNGVWLTRTVRRKDSEGKMAKKMIVPVPWRKNEDDTKERSTARKIWRFQC